MDFVHDRLVTGRRFKCLTITDPCSKEVPVIEVDVSIGGASVSDSGSAVYHASVAGHLNHGQRSRICRHGLGCLGSTTWRAPALYSTGKTRAERI